MTLNYSRLGSAFPRLTSFAAAEAKSCPSVENASASPGLEGEAMQHSSDPINHHSRHNDYDDETTKNAANEGRR
jgi:hypothetical protein